MIEVLSTIEVSRLAGVSQRQLQYWDECGTLVPRKAGRRRFYSREQAEFAKRLGGLRKAGVPIGTAIRLIKEKVSLNNLVVVQGQRIWFYDASKGGAVQKAK